MVEVFFNNATEKIEGEYHKSQEPNSPTALVLHHHSQYGGNMNNKMVHNTYCAFLNNGFSVLKINFRGMGKSTGASDKGIGELTDAATAIDWLQEHSSKSAPIWVAGLSFGTWIAMQLTMRRPEIVSFIAISPPTTKYDFSFLFPCPVPGLIVQGGDDAMLEKEDATFLIKRLMSASKTELMQHHVVDGANHFMRDKEVEVMQIIDEYIKMRLSNVQQKNTYSKVLSQKMKKMVEEYV